jgi:carboxyl-terminal processing protease
LARLNKSFDFDTKETFVYDRDKLPWIANQSDMDAMWGQRVKYDLLNLKLASADMAKNKETLKKRYENLLNANQ